MGIEKTQESFVGQWFDAQRKMLELWQTNMVPKNLMGESNSLSSKNIIEESMKPSIDLFKKWVEVTNDIYSTNIKSFGDGAYQELINKMVNGMSVYQNLNKFWEDLRIKMAGDDTDPVKFYNDWKEEYLKIVSNNFVPYLPEQVQLYFKEPLEIYSMQSDTNKKIYQPWLDSLQELRDLLAKGMTGDKNSYIEFARLWNENFGTTFGKLFGIPQMGMSRDYMQKQMDSLNSLTNLINNANEFLATMGKVNQETLEAMVKEYHEMLKTDTQPKTYKEFYSYWWTKNEDAYQNLFKTDDFGKLMGQLVDAGITFKRKFDGLLEKQLEFLPIPKKADMDSLYKTVNDLRREVRALRRELDSLKDENQKREIEVKVTEKAPAKKTTIKSTKKED